MTPWVILVVALVLGGSGYVFQAGYTQAVGSSVRQMSLPAVTALESLQTERLLSSEAISVSRDDTAALINQQKQTNQALSVMNDAARSVIQNAPDEIKQPMNRLNGDLADLPQIRERVALRAISPGELDAYFNGLFDQATALFETQARVVPQADTLQGATTAAELWRAQDEMAREIALVGTALATGDLPPASLLQIAQLNGAYHDGLVTNEPRLQPQAHDQYQQLVSSPTWQQFVAAENQVISGGPLRRGQPSPVTAAQWQSWANDVMGKSAAVVRVQADLISAKAVRDGNDALVTVGVVGSIVVTVAIGFFLISRKRIHRVVDDSLVTRLAALGTESAAKAKYLSEVVQRARDGQPVDDTNTPKPAARDYGRDEVGQLAADIAQFADHAVSATVGEARARHGARAVFTGMAHRQNLLMRKLLTILSDAERHEEDPVKLGRLYELDHTATRARRNTDNLLVLAGQHAGIRLTRPVALHDVLRAAAQEIDQYKRVDIGHIPGLTVAAEAATDTVHLLSELIDNATAFSPPKTRVQVHVESAARGAAVVIDDAGLGMEDDVRAWANTMFGQPTQLEQLVHTGDRVERVGLFTASNLAYRHGLAVEFSTSITGGTRATVLLPASILATVEPPSPPEIATTISGELPALTDVAPEQPQRAVSAAALTGATPAGSPDPLPQTAPSRTRNKAKPPLPTRNPGTHLQELAVADDQPDVVGDPRLLAHFYTPNPEDADHNETRRS